jgi:hypothetical protein
MTTFWNPTPAMYSRQRATSACFGPRRCRSKAVTQFSAPTAAGHERQCRMDGLSREDADVVFLAVGVRGDEHQVFALRLCDEHPVERIAVQQW